MAILPTRAGIRNFVNHIPTAAYWAAGVTGAYLFSGKAQDVADSVVSKSTSPSTETDPSMLEVVTSKISDTGADPLLAAGMGISAIAAGHEKPITWGLAGLGVAQLDNLFSDFATDPAYGFSDWGMDAMKEGGLIAVAYAVGLGLSALKRKI